MKPYIIDIDKTNPIGNLIDDYGKTQWNNGFISGFISGLCVITLYYIVLQKNK
jgi:hypothetical protein